MPASYPSDSETSPLVFIRPVGFSATDSMRLVTVAQDLSNQVRWRLAPTGVQADVYLAHRDRITRKQPVSRPQGSSNSGSSQGSFNTYSGTYEHTRMWVDEASRHQGVPVCLLGRANTHASPGSNRDQPPALEFPYTLEELRIGLTKITQDLTNLRNQYALGMGAWEERSRWKSHRLHVTHDARLLAVIEPKYWRVHMLAGCSVEQMQAGSFTAVPQTAPFAAVGFETVLMESALWEFAKRCPENMLASMLPSAYLREPLTHRRPSKLSEEALGDYCVAILSALDTRSRKADELQASLRLTRSALLRALACLALSRCIRPESASHSWALTLTAWLPQGLRDRVFGSTTTL